MKVSNSHWNDENIIIAQLENFENRKYFEALGLPNKDKPPISIIPLEKVKAQRSIQLFQVLEKWSSFSEF